MGTDRPLSPHLTIWKWQPTMAVSIFHRVAGNGLALAGILMLAWWLVAAASSKEAYSTFAAFAGSPFGWVIWVGLSWAFFQHLMSGIRHLMMDSGWGYALGTARSSAILVFVAAIALTAAFWAAWFAL